MDHFVERCLDGKTRSDTPFYCLSCGGPGSGKSMPAQILQTRGVRNFAIIDEQIMEDYRPYQRTRKAGPHGEKHVDTIA